MSSRAELSIPLAQPARGRGVVRLMPDGLRLLGEPWASQGPIVLRWEGPRFVVERFRLDGPAGSLSATGPLAGPEKQGLSLALDNARLPGALAELGRGAARADGAPRWRRPRADAARRAVARTRGRGLGPARGDGAIAFTGRVDAELARLGPALGVSGIGGRATLTADARGRGDAIEVTGAVRAPQIQVRGASVSDVELPLRLSRSSLRLEKGAGEARDEPDLGRRERDLDGSADGRLAGPRGADQGRDPRAGGAPRGPRAAPALGPSGARRARPGGARGGNARRGVAPEPSPPRSRSSGRGRSGNCAPRSPLDADAHRRDRARSRRVRHPDARHGHLGLGGRRQRKGDARPGAARRARDGAGRCRPAGHRTRHHRGRDALDRGCHGHGSRRARRRRRRRRPARSRAARRLGAGRRVSRRAGLPRAAPAGERQRAHRRGRHPRGRGGGPGRRPRVLSLARSGRLLPRSAARSRPGPRPACRSPSRGAARASSRSIPSVSSWRVTRGRARAPSRFAGRRAGSRSPSSGSPREGRLVSGAGTLGADGKLDARASAQVPLAMLAAMRPEIREIGGVLDLSLRASGSPTAPALAGEGAIHRGNLLLRDRPETLRDVEARFACRARACRSGRPRGRWEAAASRPGATSRCAAGSPAATGSSCRRRTSPWGRSRGSRAPGTPTSS